MNYQFVNSGLGDYLTDLPDTSSSDGVTRLERNIIDMIPGKVWQKILRSVLEKN